MTQTTLPSTLTEPLYTITEAAHVLHVPVQTFTSWAKGYRVISRYGREVTGKPLVTYYDNRRRHTPTVPFVGLAEAAFLATARRAGVPMQRVRPALEKLKDEIGLDHALASKKLYTDGAEILYDRSLETDEPLSGLVVARDNQGVFAAVIQDFLHQISYGPSGYAERIQLTEYRGVSVIVDPLINFGRPHVDKVGVEVGVIHERFDAGESVRDIADDFLMDNGEIEELLRDKSHAGAA